MFFIITTTAITLNRHGIYAHRDFPLGRRSCAARRWKVCCGLVYSRNRRRRISCHPDAGGISGVRLRNGETSVLPKRIGWHTFRRTTRLCYMRMAKT